MTDDEDLYGPFRPRFVRAVAFAGIVLVVGGLVLVLLVAPGAEAGTYSPDSVVGLVVVVLLGSLFLWRHATVRADVGPQGIRVRNLLHVRTFAWTQVVAVAFGPGDPWVMLELSDGTRHPVMGVQRSDGARGEQEARRMVVLVAKHGEAPHDG
jgi:hypothetical protein